MGIKSIWDEDGDYLTKKSKGFYALSTGCSCCSTELENEEDVKEAVIDSLKCILRASDFFKWDIELLLKETRKRIKIENKGVK